MNRHLSAKTALAGAVLVVAAGCGANVHTSTAVHIGAGASSASAPTTATRPAPRSSTTTPAATGFSTPTSAPTTTAAGDGNVDSSNPTAVAVAAITANWTSNTVVDHGPFDATLRSLVWYTPAAAAKVRASAPTGPPGATWDTWAAHRATTTVAVQLNHDPGAPADTATAAYRQFNVTVTPHGNDGWTSTPENYQVFVTLTRTSPGAPWQVASFEVAG